MSLMCHRISFSQFETSTFPVRVILFGTCEAIYFVPSICVTCSLPSQSLNATFTEKLEESKDDYQSRNEASIYWKPFPRTLLFSYQNELSQRYSVIKVTGAGIEDVNGTYYPIGLLNKSFVWQNSQHVYLSREFIDEQVGWIFGNTEVCYYGQPSPSPFPPPDGWRIYKGQQPAPEVTCQLMGESLTAAQLRAHQDGNQKVIRWDTDLKRQFM